MRLVTSIIGSLFLLGAMAGAASASVGWCGEVWPCNGDTYTSIEDITVVVQVWKAGVTDTVGQGPGIAATLFYRCTGDPTYTGIPMGYNVDIGNNDEYLAVIPAGHGCSEVEFYTEVVDLTDTTYCYGNNQGGCPGGAAPPNFFLPITDVTAQNVDVTFNLCLSDTVQTTGDVCVTGSHAVLTTWGSGVVMLQPCPVASPKLYSVTVTFPMGSNPQVDYKYRKNGCSEWEDGGNHQFFIDDSGPTQILWVDGWEYITPDCPDCSTPAEASQWGSVKSLFR